MPKEVKILGAGPAGLTAAINLRRAGYEVTVFEKNPDCGMRFHGDFQGLENWTREIDVLDDLRSMGIEPYFDYTPFKSMILVGPDMKKHVLKSDRPNYYLVRRGGPEHGNTLDQSLKMQSLALGVKILFNTIAKENDVDIIAQGSSGGDAVGQGITFTTKAQDIAITLLDNDVAPGGYAYLFVVGGRGAIVAWYFRDFHDSSKLLDLAVKKFDMLVPMERNNVKEFGGAVNFFVERSYIHKGKPRAGEGAGLQDFFASFGMRYAITSGYLAAQSIISGKDYNLMAKEKFRDSLNASLVNRWLWERMDNRKFQKLLRHLESMKDTRKFLSGFYKMTFAKRLLLPLVKLLMKSKEHRYNCECVWCRSKKQEMN